MQLNQVFNIFVAKRTLYNTYSIKNRNSHIKKSKKFVSVSIVLIASILRTLSNEIEALTVHSISAIELKCNQKCKEGTRNFFSAKVHIKVFSSYFHV